MAHVIVFSTLSKKMFFILDKSTIALTTNLLFKGDNWSCLMSQLNIYAFGE